jgi:phosphate transport system substrate-binding protein
MKKKLSTVMLIVLSAVMALGFAACGSDGGSGDNGGYGSSADFDASKEISVVSREDGSGTRGSFVELFGVQEEVDGNKRDMTTLAAVIANKTDVMMTNVAGDKTAIGYISLGSLNETVKGVSIDGAEPTPDNVKNGSYAISRPFNIVTKGDATGLAKDFIDFILSSDGQTIVSGNSYIAIDDGAAAYSGDKPSGKIVVAGSSSVTPVMEKLREAYLAINANAKIEVQMTDSSAGIQGAIDGSCDIGMSSRELKDSESDKVKGTQIALDGIAVIVNKENPVTNLTKDQVKGIFKGEVAVWSDIL